jgi:hypothetical protein
MDSKVESIGIFLLSHGLKTKCHFLCVAINATSAISGASCDAIPTLVSPLDFGHLIPPFPAMDIEN